VSYIYHLVFAEDWERALESPGGRYTVSTRGTTLAETGFIHCSYRDQVIRIADAIYADVPDLLLLIIDTDRLRSPVVAENLDGGTERFPHIYGPLNTDAVVKVEPYR